MMNRKIMKRDSGRKAARAVAAAVLVESIAAMGGCSLIVGGLEVPNETTPAGGSAGMGGMAGSGGLGGKAGSGGQGGTTTQGGNGGEAGHAGAGGEAGFGGFGGEAGTGGTAGSGGAGGSAGNGGAGGSGTVCPGVFDEVVSGSPFYVGIPKPVGGYEITNTGQSGNGILVDIECAANHAVVDQAVYCNEGGPETPVTVTVDGKRIRLTDLGDSQTLANMNVTVEPL